MPKPALLPDGALAAYFLGHRGPGLAPTPDVQTMTARYSTDEGRTWSDPQELFTLPAEEGGFGYFVVLVDQDGEVHFFLLNDANTGVVRLRPESHPRGRVEPLPRQSLDVWHVKSTDARTHWTTPRRIWQGRAGDPQSVIQLSNGRIILPLSYFVDRNWGRRGEGFDAFTYMGQFDTTVLYSDDEGETWQRSESVLRTPTPNLSAYGAVEPVVIERSDGSVWMLLRTQLGRFYESSSRDGATWSPPRPSAILSSDSPAGLLRLPDNRMLLIWNNCQRYPYAQGARNVLHAAVSEDDGMTWCGYREILRDPHRDHPPPPSGDHGVSYPFPTLTSDGNVAYSLWVQTGDGRTLEWLDPAWLNEIGQREDFSAGLDGWSVYGTRGAEIVDVPCAVNSRALGLRKAETSWPAAAVWNFPLGQNGRLRMRLRAEAGSGDLSVQLTDHFSVPFDEQDEFFSVFKLRIGPDIDEADGVRIPNNEWVDLELDWDGDRRVCHVTMDGQQVAELSQSRDAPGVCYLRLRALDEQVNAARVLIDTVEVDVSNPETMNTRVLKP